MLTDVGQRVGTRSRIETYTEVVLQKGAGDSAHRPDGLIVVRHAGGEWTALGEAKVGTSMLTTDQVESYLDVAKLNGIDALITISNQFAAPPSDHPVELSAIVRKKAAIFHWPWMHVLTEATLLLSNEGVVDRDQRVILNEMVRFLTHPSAGVQGFDQMPAAWSELVAAVQAGATISVSAPVSREVVGAWHQVTRDLSFVLSRQLGTEVGIRVTRAHAADPAARQKADLSALATSQCLEAGLVIPDAAAPVYVLADLRKRSLTVSMQLRAPAERQSTRARLNWLLRQLAKTDPANVFIRFFWPGRATPTLHALSALRDNPDLGSVDRRDLSVTSFEVLLVRDLGARFAQRRNFVGELSAVIPVFYEQIGQYLRVWQAPAPKVREDRVEPDNVDTPALREEADAVALARDE